jgi:hypothetical protein
VQERRRQQQQGEGAGLQHEDVHRRIGRRAHPADEEDEEQRRQQVEEPRRQQLAAPAEHEAADGEEGEAEQRGAEVGEAADARGPSSTGSSRRPCGVSTR